MGRTPPPPGALEAAICLPVALDSLFHVCPSVHVMPLVAALTARPGAATTTSSLDGASLCHNAAVPVQGGGGSGCVCD